jgi:DNA-binding transcriptional MerR regulator
VASHHPIRKQLSPEPPVIPDKLYFRIGDVARLCEVPAYVLRFWETEFPQLKPNKGGTGQRLYRKRDVEMALRIKSLLYDQGYTIPGARQVFLSESKAKEAPESVPPSITSSAPPQVIEPQPAIDLGAAIRQGVQHRDQLSTLRDELRSLANLLAKPVPADPPAPAAPTPVQPATAAIENSTPDDPPDAKVVPMRPRLVLEPKPEPRPELRLIDQGDLFPSE